MNFIDEFLLTFSNRPSFFSSKKIERFIVFGVFLGITIAYITMHIKDLDAIDFVTVIGVWLGYGGFNSVMTLKDKQTDKGKEEKIEG